MYFDIKFFFDIRIGHEYRILTFKIPFYTQNKTDTRLGPNSAILHSNPYFDVLTVAEYHIFYIKNHILTLELRPNIVFLSFKNPIVTFKLGSNIVF